MTAELAEQRTGANVDPEMPLQKRGNRLTTVNIDSQSQLEFSMELKFDHWPNHAINSILYTSNNSCKWG